MKPRKAGRVGVDLGEWFALVPFVVGLIHDAGAVKAMPKGQERKAAIRDLVFAKLDALVDWLDNAMDD